MQLRLQAVRIGIGHMNKRTEHTLVAIALVATGVTGGVLGHLAHTEQPAPTVVSCSAWADTSDPVLPPNTVPDVCVTDDGYLSTPGAPEPQHSTTEVTVLNNTQFSAPIKEK